MTNKETTILVILQAKSSLKCSPIIYSGKVNISTFETWNYLFYPHNGSFIWFILFRTAEIFLQDTGKDQMQV